MSAANSPKLSTTTLNISENARLHIRYRYWIHSKIYPEKFDYEVCLRRKNRVRHLTPFTLDRASSFDRGCRDNLFHTQVRLPSYAKPSPMTLNHNCKNGNDQSGTPMTGAGGSNFFDYAENEKPPWYITCCCIERQCETSLLVLF